MTNPEQLAIARLKHLHQEAVDTAFFMERSGNKILQAVACSIKTIAQAIYKVSREAQRQQAHEENNPH
jgi:hypothetical protein